MIIRRTVKAVATTAVLGLVIAGFAAPSHANTTVTVTGSLVSRGSGWTGASFTPNQAFGPTVTISVSTTGTNDDDFFVKAGGVLVLKEDGEPDKTCSGQNCVIVVGEPATFEVLQSAVNSPVSFEEDGGLPISGSFTVSYLIPPTPQDPRDGFRPASHIQQFAMPGSGSCDEAQPEGLNWGASQPAAGVSPGHNG